MSTHTGIMKRCGVAAWDGESQLNRTTNRRYHRHSPPAPLPVFLALKLKSSSSFGQDLFAWIVNGRPNTGTFLDMGCGLPWDSSNSYGLERLGWTGWLCDNTDRLTGNLPSRTSPFFLCDGRMFDFSILPSVTNYLSLDVDDDSVEVLTQILNSGKRFKAITVEHDLFSGGHPREPDSRSKQRRLLSEAGYRLIFGDVCCHLGPLEDWWIGADTLLDLRPWETIVKSLASI